MSSLLGLIHISHLKIDAHKVKEDLWGRRDEIQRPTCLVKKCDSAKHSTSISVVIAACLR